MPDARTAAAADPPADDKAHADVGIVAALPIEMGPFLDRCERVRKYSGGPFTFRGGKLDGTRIVIVESGLGFARARRAAQALLDAHTPKWILSCGFSGALLPEMKVGQIVLANSIVDVHGHEMTIDLNVPEDRAGGLYVGRVLTADEMVRTVERKRRLAAERQAIAVDMESLAVAQVCRESKTRFMAIRAISDDMSADLPQEVFAVLGSSGTIRVGATLGAVWKRPGSVKDMWRLREQARHAAENLAKFLLGVIPQLTAGP
ncbi:MAG: 5'-methylthioadenosine nucleosidase [Planctomycetaceae bacterium]